MQTKTLAEHMRRQARNVGAVVEEINEDDNASGGFREGCDAYEAFAFLATRDGRSYYITVEDVTIKADA